MGILLSIKLWQWALLVLWLVGSRVSYHHEWGPVYVGAPKPSIGPSPSPFALLSKLRNPSAQ